MTPFGWAVIGFGAIAAAVAYLAFQNNKLNEEYERKLNLNITNSMSNESKTVDKLVSRYLALGMSLKEATRAAIQFEQNAINIQKIKIQSEIGTIEKQIASNQVSIPLPGGGTAKVDLPGNDALRDKLLAKKQIQTGLFSESLALTNYGINRTQNAPLKKEPSFTNSDRFSRQEMSQIFSRPTEPIDASVKNDITITVKNDSDNAASVKLGKTSIIDVLPKTTSTKTISK